MGQTASVLQFLGTAARLCSVAAFTSVDVAEQYNLVPAKGRML